MLKTALIVDDDHLEREYLTELLLRNDYVVRSAPSVPNAAALIRTMRFDAIFIDDRMPSMTGALALSEIKNALPDDAQVQTYLMGDAQDESARNYKKDGFTAFLEKPVDVARLFPAVSPEEGDSEESSVWDARGAAEESTLDEKRGIANCGTKENYHQALKIFMDSAESKSQEIWDFYGREDWNDYTIKVHALKSSARIIGAEALSAKAAELEDAGNREDIAKIRRDTRALLDDYRRIRDLAAEKLGLSKTDEEEDGRPAAGEERIRDAYRSIADFAGQMDYDLVEMVLTAMNEFHLESGDREKFDRIRRELLALDWEGILREVQE